ncbi:hypothetical protein F5884DRAFT_664169 [Xylogone sp. PMI_703]|nr:hypothetical protein F5884DRAFT_664169 [Xylogone sp. PMI_703]
MPAVADEDAVADVDEPPDHQHSSGKTTDTNFLKSAIRPQPTQKESLLTKALTNPAPSAAQASPDLLRRQSTRSNASLASTAELTSDGGLTSPDRTTTPSPPFPNNIYTNFASYTLRPTGEHIRLPATIRSTDQRSDIVSVSPKANAPVNPAPRKTCITFACGGRNDAATKPAVAPQPVAVTTAEAPKRPCTIKFACPAPRPEKSASKPAPTEKTPPLKLAVPQRRPNSRSPSMTRKSRPATPPRGQRDSLATVKRTSRSPEVARKPKTKYIIAEDKDLESSQFHEFASEQVQEDDWIRKESECQLRKLTINDTLKKENDIRRLGSEAEEEELEDFEDEEEDDEDDQDQDEEEEEDEDEDDEEDNDVDIDDDASFDEAASDGNETDNEAGFADSDDESDGGEFQFWTPGQPVSSGQPSIYFSQGARAASVSSIDSLNHMDPSLDGRDGASPRRPKRSRRIKIRPGTPDLPDSTDFVCGTLDEDRPLEEAYVSCMEARKREKHKQVPQDIDPSFPTSDPEDEEDELGSAPPQDSDENVWLHGKFEDSGDEMARNRRRSTTAHRKSPGISPRRLHSPPPPKRRLSPAPPKRRLHSPPPRKHLIDPSATMTINSPATTPTSHATSQGITFVPLASRPGVAFTKSLPRTPNPLCLEYRSSRLIAMEGDMEGSCGSIAPVRSAIDIVKGLEQKKQRRREKFCQKYAANRARKGQSERPVPPGKGAERMRELGLLMAGKTGQDPYMLSA